MQVSASLSWPRIAYRSSPRPSPFSGPNDPTYGPLPAPLGAEPRAWAVCRFVDPIADIAVLGSPGDPHADEYKALMQSASALSIGGSTRNPRNLWVAPRDL